MFYTKLVGKITKDTDANNSKVNYILNINSYVQQNGRLNRVYDGEEFIQLMQDTTGSNHDAVNKVTGNMITIASASSKTGFPELAALIGKNVILEVELTSGIKIYKDHMNNFRYCLNLKYTGGDVTKIGLITLINDIQCSLDNIIEKYEKLLSKCKDQLEVEIKEKDKNESKEDVDSFIESLDPDYQRKDEDGGYETAVDKIYKDKWRSIYYLLKYGYAYPYLYYYIYRDILSRIFFNYENIDVMSIGCGSKMDLLGLKLAMNKLGYKNKVSYYGIELGDWNKNDLCIFTGDGSIYDNSNIVDYLNSTENIYANVIMFPYSLSELVDRDYETGGMTPWEHICDKLPGKLVCNRIYIATPIKKGGTTLQTGEEYLDDLASEMINCGYEKVGETRVRNGADSSSKFPRPISDEMSLRDKLGYNINGSVKTFMDGLADRVNTDEDTKIKSSPISNNFIIGYQIYVFER